MNQLEYCKSCRIALEEWEWCGRGYCETCEEKMVDKRIIEALEYAFTNRDKTDNVPDSLSRLGVEILEFNESSESIEIEIDGKPVTLKIIEV